MTTYGHPRRVGFGFGFDFGFKTGDTTLIMWGTNTRTNVYLVPPRAFPGTSMNRLGFAELVFITVEFNSGVNNRG